MTLEEYCMACRGFDWSYMMSDDHSVWKRGTKREDELKALWKTYPEYQAIYEAYHDWYWKFNCNPDLMPTPQEFGGSNED